MYALPKGWVETTLSEIVIPRNEKVSPKLMGNKPFIGLEHVEAHSSKIIGTGKCSDMRSAVARFHSGDILYGRLRPYLNKVVRPDFDGGASAEMIVLKTAPDVAPEFVHKLIMTRDFLDFTSQLDKGDRPRVKYEEVSEYKVALPPANEQRRIAKKLDNLFIRSRMAQEELTPIPHLVEHYKKAILSTAFSGKLTRDWRKDKKRAVETLLRYTINDPYEQNFYAPQHWAQISVGQMCDISGGSQPPKSTFVYNPKPGYIRLIQIRDYKSDKKITYIPEALARKKCSATDVMIGRYGPPIFQILRGLEGAYNVALMKAEPLEGCDNDFLFYRLKCPELLMYVEMGSDRTAGQDGVNKDHLLKYPIFLPPEDEQKEIVRRIEKSFAAIDAITAQVAAGLQRLSHLEAQCLNKAFRGELVPQDPNDEPASALLERLRAESVPAKPKRKGRKVKG